MPFPLRAIDGMNKLTENASQFGKLLIQTVSPQFLAICLVDLSVGHGGHMSILSTAFTTGMTTTTAAKEEKSVEKPRVSLDSKRANSEKEKTTNGVVVSSHSRWRLYTRLSPLRGCKVEDIDLQIERYMYGSLKNELDNLTDLPLNNRV